MNKSKTLRLEQTFTREIDKDREELISYFKKINIYPSKTNKSIEKNFNLCHRYIYSLCFWPHYFKEEIIYRKIFLEQLRTDALQSLYLSLLGLKKPTKLLFRSIIEDLLNHIYFYDHKIEFEKLESEYNFYINTNELWEYVDKHPRLNIVIKESDSLNILKIKYKEYSKYIHSQSVNYMDLKRTYEEVNFDVEFFNECKNNIIKIIENVNYILYIFYVINIEHFKPDWISYTIDLIPRHYKNTFSKL